MIETVDSIVIGTGGGTKLVRPAVALGKRVVVIEKGRLGGTCLNHGCIPSKMLIHAADVATAIKTADKFSLDATLNGVDFSGLVTRVSQTIDAQSDSIEPLYNKTDNLTLIQGHARFIDNHTVRVNNRSITAKQIFIATGCKAYIPDLPGLGDYLTYKTALRLTEQPQSLVIIGGGYIAVELGHYFAALGTNVTFVTRSGFISQEDPDCQAEFTRVFKAKHAVYDHARITHIDYTDNHVHVHIKQLNSDTVITANQLLLATGITPETDDLGLHNTDIQVDSRGYIQTNDHLQTTVGHIMALGDVRGVQFFRHTANFEGEYVFNRHVANTHTDPIQYPVVPHAIFTDPQVAGIGIIETNDNRNQLIIGKNSYQDSAMGMALLSDHGFVKVLFDKSSKKLVGAHIIGPEAATMIHMCMAFMHMQATLDDMASLMYIHPALPEIVRNAVRQAVTVAQTSR